MKLNQSHRSLLLKYRQHGVSLDQYKEAFDGSVYQSGRDLCRACRQLAISIRQLPLIAFLLRKVKG